MQEHASHENDRLASLRRVANRWNDDYSFHGVSAH